MLPHVYRSSAAEGNILSESGQKFTRPVGTTEHVEDVNNLSLCSRTVLNMNLVL